MVYSTTEEAKPMCKLKSVPSEFKMHRFSAELPGRVIIFQVVKMLDSLMLFINYKDDMYISDLSLALQSRYSNTALHTQIIGNIAEDASRTLAAKLTKKLNKPVYVSCNVEKDRLITPALEKALFDEVKCHPEAF